MVGMEYRSSNKLLVFGRVKVVVDRHTYNKRSCRWQINPPGLKELEKVQNKEKHYWVVVD